MKEPAYIKIHCEHKRKEDMRWRFRTVKDRPPGRALAHKTDRWRCCHCGKPVSVSW
jgi:hypothetical protein